MANTKIPSELVAINAISGTLIADNAITSVHIAENNITATQIAINAVTALQMADGTITSAKIADGTIVTADIADGQITTGKLADSSVTTGKIVAGTIASADIANNAILTQHIDDNQITADQIADNAVGVDQLAGITRGSVLTGNAAGNPSLLALGAANTLLQSDGTDLVFAPLQSGIDDNSNAVAITIDSSEQVGIGTTAPTQKLDVNGNIAVGYNTTDNNQILKTYATAHASGNRGGQLEFGINDGAFSGIKVINSVAANSSYNKQEITFTTHEGAVSVAERMRITSTGNVGIGTINPSAKLDVASATGNVGFNYGTSSSPERGNLWYNTDGSGWKFNIGKVQSNSFTSQVTIQDNGNVGIGTSSPSFGTGSGLEIERAGIATLRLQNSNSKSVEITQDSDFKIESMNSGADIILMPTANVGIGTNNPTMGKLQVTGPKYVITNSGKALGGIHVNPASGATLGQFGGAISLSAGGNGSSAIAAVNDGGTDNDSTGLAFFVHSSGTGADDATEVVRIDQIGNVGIGTTNPASKLHISGNSDVSDEDCQLIIEDVDGSAGSRIPSIQFRSFTSSTVTNQGRIRATDTQGMILSGSSAQGDDLVVKAGKVGVGMIPVEVLDLKAASGDTRLRLDAASGSDTEIKFFNAGAAQYTVGHDDATDNFVIGTTNVDAPLVSISKAGNISLNGGGTIEAPSVGGGETLALKAAGGITAIIDSNGNSGDNQFFKVQKHTNTDLFTVQENGAVEVAGTLNSGGTLSTTASVGVNHLLTSTHSYSSNRNWAIKTNNYGSSNWGGWCLEQSTAAGGTPSVARIGVHLNGNVGINMGGDASTSLTDKNPATALHVGGDITVGSADAVGTGAASAIRFVNDNERSRITSNYASGGGGEMGFWTDTTGGTLVNRAYIKNDGSFNFNGPVKMHSNYWATNDVLRAYSIGGPSTTSLTRTINVNTYWNFAAQGGAFMYMLHGWQGDSAMGMVHWSNAGNNTQVITSVYHNELVKTGLTSITVAKGSGNYDIDITLAATHSNTHGWYWKVWA